MIYYVYIESYIFKCWTQYSMRSLVAQLDAHPPGMQMVAGSILWSGNILIWRLGMKSFLRPFSPYDWFK